MKFVSQLQEKKISNCEIPYSVVEEKNQEILQLVMKLLIFHFVKFPLTIL